jgi:hypothetical protein
MTDWMLSVGADQNPDLPSGPWTSEKIWPCEPSDADSGNWWGIVHQVATGLSPVATGG